MSFGGTRDPGPIFWVRPGTLKVESETQDRYFTWELRPGTKRLKEGSGTLTKGETKTQSKHLLSNLERKNYDSNELNQISYK